MRALGPACRQRQAWSRVSNAFLWSQVTKYISTLRLKSTKCSRPRLAVLPARKGRQNITPARTTKKQDAGAVFLNVVRALGLEPRNRQGISLELYQLSYARICKAILQYCLYFGNLFL